MPNPFSEAIQEAYNLAPSNLRILHTLELRHTSIQGGAIRVVRDYGELIDSGDPDIRGWNLTLENDALTAPIDTGQSVLFLACMFDMTPPQQHENPPTFDITIDNVTAIISPSLDAVAASGTEIAICYREWLADDHSVPQYILPGGHIQTITSTANRIRATVIFSDLVNVNFPSVVYRPDEFPSLQR